MLFPDEYEVALEGREVINKFISRMINDDEVGFITLHIHSAISSNQVAESMEATRIIHESIIKLENDLNIVIDIQSVSYARLMNHIKFLILRLNKNEELQMDISEFTKDKFPFAYEQASNMCEALSKVLKKKLPELKKLYQQEKTPIFVTGRILKNKELKEIQDLIKKSINVEVEFDTPKALGLNEIRRTYNRDVEISESKIHRGSLRSGQRLEY